MTSKNIEYQGRKYVVHFFADSFPAIVEKGGKTVSLRWADVCAILATV